MDNDKKAETLDKIRLSLFDVKEDFFECPNIDSEIHTIALLLTTGKFNRYLLYQFLLQFDRDQFILLSQHFPKEYVQQFSACLAINEARELDKSTMKLNTENKPKRL